MEENAGKIISLSSYSGIIKIWINALLFEIDEPNHRYTAQISTLENNIEVIDIITLTYDNTTPNYTVYNNGTTINSTEDKTYYLIDYYNRHVIKFDIDNSGASPELTTSIDNLNIDIDNTDYVKDLILLVELNISKIGSNNNYTSYFITIRALSSPENQHITPWIIETPLILNTYKSYIFNFYFFILNLFFNLLFF